MKQNVARTLAAFGMTGALVLGFGAPALAADSGMTLNDYVVSAVSRTLDDVTLAAGGALDAESYLVKLDESVEWTTCGVSTYGIGDGLMGSGCSDGTIVIEESMGVAHKTLPLGTQIQIVYDGTVVNATVHDRGPFVAGRDLDLQPAVARALGFDGVGMVQYRVVG